LYSNHFKGTRVRRNAAIRKDDLRNGGVSVWRLVVVADVAAMTAKLESVNPQNELRRTISCTAAEVRAIRFSRNSSRSVCLVDDIRTSDPAIPNPTTDEAHAAACFCAVGDPTEYDQVFEDLRTLFFRDVE
jgi:hypothetical protein